MQYQAKFGHHELFAVASAMASDGSRRQVDKDIVLRQCMKSQLLIWRPGPEGVLELAEKQSWAKNYPTLPAQSGLQPD